MRIAFSFIISFLLFTSCTSNDADLIIHNATIYTVNERFETATAVVVKDGKFIAVGGEDLLNQYKARSIVNLNGFSVYPGFIDAHSIFIISDYCKNNWI